MFVSEVLARLTDDCSCLGLYVMLHNCQCMATVFDASTDLSHCKFARGTIG
jgi:hypothetical protein